MDISGGPISYMSVESTDMTLEELSWFVDNTVAKKLLAIPGMAQVAAAAASPAKSASSSIRRACRPMG